MQKMLKDIGEIILGHSFRGAIVEVENGNYSVLQAKNVKVNGIVEDDELVRIDLMGTKVNALMESGDVVLSNRGTFRAGFFYGRQQNVIAASSVYIIRINNREMCLPEYLTIYLNSQAGQTLLEVMNRGTLIKSLPKKSLMEFSLPLPHLHVQKTVIDIHKNYATRADLYERKLRLEEQIANQTITSLISQ